MKNKWTIDNIPSLEGKRALVTGANSGLGYHTALRLAGQGAEVWLLCRNEQRGEQAREAIQKQHPQASLHVTTCDLADLDQVREITAHWSQMGLPLHILVNNAGVMVPPEGKTAQGHELQWGINYLSHFALTAGFYPYLRKAQGRIVNLSSLAAQRGQIHFSDPNFTKKYQAWAAYGQSKLAMLMFSMALHRRLAGSGTSVKAFAAHPGLSETALFEPMRKKLPWPLSWIGSRLILPALSQPAEQGALSQIYAATVPELPSGAYIGPNGSGERKGYPAEARIPAQARVQEDQDRLWQLSEEQSGVDFDL